MPPTIATGSNVMGDTSRFRRLQSGDRRIRRLLQRPTQGSMQQCYYERWLLTGQIRPLIRQLPGKIRRASLGRSFAPPFYRQSLAWTFRRGCRTNAYFCRRSQTIKGAESGGICQRAVSAFSPNALRRRPALLTVVSLATERLHEHDRPSTLRASTARQLLGSWYQVSQPFWGRFQWLPERFATRVDWRPERVFWPCGSIACLLGQATT
jgi:hypothetical protein